MSTKLDSVPWRRPLRAVTLRIEQLSDTQFVYVLLSPVFLLLAVVAFWPIVNTFELSLHADSIVSPDPIGEFAGFTNYVDLFTGGLDALMPRPFVSLSQPLKSALIVTVVFAGVSVSIETLLGFAQALILNEEFRGRRWVRLVLILPWAVPIVIFGTMFYLMFNSTVGFGSEILHGLGLISATPFTSTQDSLLLLIIADIWKTTPFMVLLILAGLQSINRDLYQVAEVAGASRWQRFRHVTLPLVAPILGVAILFRLIQALRVYGVIEVMVGCNTVPSLSCMVVSTFQSRYYGTSATIAFTTAALIGLVTLGYFAFTKSEVV
ncbi:sugar ABC transporter permease [Haloferax gibbonsii ATCC 33959]|uniref:Sugar ABC transporter permease n=1 Tax=Haloferax gibbonsii (strain ATCC 33959 / DSM 4427 / JCM 8863 / NBRC 102184 / NCIMB 2188 / Ma 2.38) TaxID=1227459 RepID=M0GZL9_HALGM|nr:sugar ABC transporter permease [Haloferax gibbonsii]ELZ76314.1 sugar ABC transporter permease [Haloferax gibbonsii ATCC 33959]